MVSPPPKPTPGDRLRDWIQETASLFAEPFGGFLGGTLASALETFFTNLEPGVIDQVQEILTGVKDIEGFPEEYKRFIDKSLGQGNVWVNVSGWVLSLVGVIFALFALGGPPGRLLNQRQEYALRTHRLDPLSAVNLWRRDPEKYEEVFYDLKEQGWSDDRIEALKFVTQFMPTPQDLVTWQAREVFEPGMIRKYGLDDEFETLDLSLFAKVGVTKEQALNYWRAHWEHASWNQVVEMLRRGLITEEDVYEWFKVVEIVPYWRELLIAISWEVPTRVDVRRFWDMRTIDETRLRQIYTAMGYHNQDLEDYVLWTKIYVDFPDLMTRFKNGWLTLDEVRQELIRLGMSEDRAEELIQTKVKAEASEKLAKDRDLTMSQIVKGVKKSVITRVEGAQLLMDMGYDEAEALFILAIEIPVDEEVAEVTKRELTKSDILNGLKNALITEQEALAKLLELRYTADDAQFILNIYKATVSPPEEERGRQASKADITKAVKNGLITAEDGYLMLIDIGFEPSAAEFILMVQAETSPFSPQSFEEFKELTGQWRNIVMPTSLTTPEEVKDAADALVQITKEIESIEEAIKLEKANLVGEEPLPEEVTAKLTELEVTLHRAQSERQRLQQEYDRVVAVWKHQEG